MKKTAVFMFLMYTVSAGGLLAQAASGMFTLSADFSISFGSVETEYTEAPLKITGYGIGESVNLQTAAAKARAEAYEQMGKQAAGVDFRYRKTDSSVTLEFFFTELVTGAQVISSTVLPKQGNVSRVFVVAGVEMPVVLPKGGKFNTIRIEGTGDDIDSIMAGMMKDAVKRAVAGMPAGGAAAGAEIGGILYLSNLSLKMNE